MATAIVQVYDKKLKLSSKKTAKFKYDFKICRIQGKRKCIQPFSIELSQHDKELGVNRLSSQQMLMQFREHHDDMMETDDWRLGGIGKYGYYASLKSLNLDNDEIVKLGEILNNVRAYKSAGYIDILED